MRASWIMVTTLAAALGFSACGSTSSSPSSASPAATTLSSLTGTWSGASSDSSGSMMGAGLTTSMMNSATWQVTQNGSAFTGSMQFQGYGGGPMTVSGTVSGHTGTFTMTVPTGSMMMNGTCNATAMGTFDMDDLMTQMHGTYTGTNTCSGAFDHGQVSLTRR